MSTDNTELRKLWRDSGLYPKFWILDARAIFPVFIFFLHWCLETFIVAIIATGGLYAVQKTGMSPAACLRFLRSKCAGRIREARTNEVVFRRRCRW